MFIHKWALAAAVVVSSRTDGSQTITKPVLPITSAYVSKHWWARFGGPYLLVYIYIYMYSRTLSEVRALMRLIRWWWWSVLGFEDLVLERARLRGLGVRVRGLGQEDF